MVVQFARVTKVGVGASYTYVALAKLIVIHGLRYLPFMIVKFLRGMIQLTLKALEVRL
jgi:hypothetical protein